MKFLFILFIVMPVAEISLLFKVGEQIGALWTIGLILTTAFIGVNLIRQQGIMMLLRAGNKMQSGEIPAQELAEGFLIALSGAFLLTPGFITDSIGFSLLVPAVRKKLIGYVIQRWQAKPGQHFYYQSSHTYDGNVVQEEVDVSVYAEETDPFRSRHSNASSSTLIEGQFQVDDNDLHQGAENSSEKK